MRRFLSIIFSIVFLLVFVSLFSQKSLADTCSYAGTYKYDFIPNPYGNTPGTPTISQELQNALNDALSKCNTANSTDCTSAASTIQTEINGINAYNQVNVYKKYCTDTMDGPGIGDKHHSTCNMTIAATCPTTPIGTTPTPTPVDTGTVPIGTFGCAIKISDSKPIAPSCKIGATCVPVPPTSTVDFEKAEIVNGYCLPTQTKCPACDSGYEFIPVGAQCEKYNSDDGTYTKVKAVVKTCNAGETCSSLGYGCLPGRTAEQRLSACPGGVCSTALGPLQTDLPKLLTQIFTIALTIAGIAALGLIIASGYRLMISQGNPEQVKGAREQLTAAIIGLLFIIFSLVILQVVGHSIINIPGFN